ncbi:hypothetical protein As57867_001790, partial [Aphanomyces stellatus]
PVGKNSGDFPSIWVPSSRLGTLLQNLFLTFDLFAPVANSPTRQPSPMKTTAVMPAGSGAAPVVLHAARKLNRIKGLCGVLYIALSVALAAYVLGTHFAVYLENDLFWPSFRASGMQNAVIDLFNNRLATLSTNASMSYDLLGATIAAAAPYDQAHVALGIDATYARRLLFTQLTDVHAAIAGLRSPDADAYNLMTAFCWLDLNRTWEMGRSTTQQSRCYANQRDNGAMYFEAVYRNAGFATSARFNLAIGNAISTTPAGVAWLSYMQSLPAVPGPVQDEAALWLSHGVTRFQPNWSNLRTIGIEETIAVTNALGLTFTIRIKHVFPTIARATCTAQVLFCPFGSSIYALNNHGTTTQSLILNSPGSYTLSSPNAIEAYWVGSHLAPLLQVLHSQLGPLGNVVSNFIAPPTEVVTLVQTFQAAVMAQAGTNTAFATAYHAIGGAVTVHPTPPLWQARDVVFYGGSPLCPYHSAKPYILASFGADDTCMTYAKHGVTWTPAGALFAWLLADPAQVPQIASTCLDATVLCQAQAVATQAASTLFDASSLPTSASAAALGRLSLEMMQFVSTNNASNLAIQTVPLLTGPWTVFGYMSVYDWVLGTREVVAFEGDAQVLTLVSYVYEPLQQYASPYDVGSTVGVGMHWIAAAATVVSASVACVLLVLHVVFGCRMTPDNWFVFNRVVAFAWVGRSVLFVRGLAAAVILSTANVALTPPTANGLTGLTRHPRNILDSMALSGETLWIMYIANDVLHGFTDSFTSKYAPISSSLAWLTVSILDIAAPPAFTATVARQCSLTTMDIQISCTSGSIQIGQVGRLAAIFAIHGVCLVVPLVAVALWHRPPRHQSNLLLPCSSSVFLCEFDTTAGFFCLDTVSATMCGVLNFPHMVFDVNLWLKLPLDDYSLERDVHGLKLPDAFTRTMATSLREYTSRTHSMVSGALKRVSRGASSQSMKLQSTHLDTLLRWFRHAATMAGPALLVASLVYVVGSLFGNAIYMTVTAPEALGNDFFWVHFNTSGTHAFLGTVFNQQLLSTTTATSFALDNFATIVDVTQQYDKPTTIIPFGEATARSQLYDPAATSLDTVVQNLRAMDPCMLPWMFTQYCWVDFPRQWELATSLARQRRCQTSAQTNGAAYLEAPLRNVRSWAAWSQCWGTPYELGIAQAVRQSGKTGMQWLDATQHNINSVADETVYWRTSGGITQFALQWQNYKSLGMTDSLQIQNALGFGNAITLSERPSAYRFKQQTSWKCYWTFASDLYAIGNSSGTAISGLSLVRSAANYAFTNTTPEALLLANLTLASPLTPGFAAFHAVVGPFGNIDMQYIVPPSSLKQVYRTWVDGTVALLAQNTVAQDAFFNQIQWQEWIGDFPPNLANPNYTVLGGNLLCGSDQSSYAVGSVTPLYAWFSSAAICNGLHYEFFTTADVFLQTFAVAAFDATIGMAGSADFNEFCAWDAYAESNCMDIYASTYNFTSGLAAAVSTSLKPMAIAAQHDVAALHIQVIQVILNNTTPGLFQQQIFSTDPQRAWVFFGWCYMYDWVVGTREVVSFQGDISTVTTLSSPTQPLSIQPNANEIPTGLAFTLLKIVQYITGVFIAVACIIAIYIVVCRGRIQSINLFELNRLVGLVWVGRPLLIVRSLTALILLNTQRLDLATNGAATGFTSPQLVWYNLLLAAGEVNWFVYVMNDALSVVTQEYTPSYATKSTMLTWAVFIVWTIASPCRHTATIARTCVAVDMDFGLFCNSGVVEIGRLPRLGLSIGVAIACVVGSYILELATRRGTYVDIPSCLLSSQAKYFLELANEPAQTESLRMDKVSAVLAGILSFTIHKHVYVLDVKKWRFLRTAWNDGAELAHAVATIPIHD